MDEPDPLVSAARRRLARPELNQLEVFLKVVETGSFSAAARQLGRTQPAVSQTIARLEEIYGGDLFMRRPGVPLSLTPIGKAILPSVRALLHTADELMGHALTTAQGQRGSLTIGLDDCLCLAPLSASIRAFNAASPEVRLRFVEAPARELHRQLNQRLVDIIFVTQFEDLTCSRMMHEGLWEEQLMIVMRDDHPLAGKGSLDLSDIASLSLNIPASLRDAAGSVFARLSQDPTNCAYHDASPATLLEMVAMGFGQTIAFSSAMMPRPGIVTRPVDGSEAFVKIDAMWPAEDRNPLRHRLLSFIRKTKAQ